eukprot:SM000262S09879  [mRNA]  locus=s262:12303:12636:- [translate_table: standard]
MVRVATFGGLVAVTLVGMAYMDRVYAWMARRQEAKWEQIKQERAADELRRQLLQELREKQSAGGG